MRLTRIGIAFLSLFFVLLVTVGFAKAAPQMATALVEGRNYDQAHDSGYIDWSGPVQYVYMTHRDFTSLPPEEGGMSCASGCQEWVTRIGNGGSVSGSFDRNVSYFELMVGFTHDSSVGSASVRACGSVSTANLYLGSGGGLPGFVSMSLSVPAGCRSWSLSASGGYVNFRSVDVNYVVIPPTATFTPSRTPTATHAYTSTSTATLTPTSTITDTPTHTVTSTFTPSFTPTHTVTLTFTPSVTMTLSLTPTRPATSTPAFTPTVSTTPSKLPTNTVKLLHLPPRVSISDRWWIWENGTLNITRGTDSLASVKVIIYDSLNRWLPAVLEFDQDGIPDSITWDRHFADGTLAPSGEYPIVVRACDVHGLCGQDKGVIAIPFVGTWTPSMASPPTVTITLTPAATSTSSPVLPTQTLVLPEVTPEKHPDHLRTSFPFWQILGLIEMFMVIASASLVDRRPEALKGLGNAFRQISTQASNVSTEDKQNNVQKRM